MAAAQRLEYSLRFYMAEENISILQFPDWETLPYDKFSPHQDIISERLTTLSKLPNLTQGILITPIQTLMHRIAPKSYLDGFCLSLGLEQKFDIDEMRLRLEHSGYNCVSSVMEHGEFAVRGSLFDLFPMGSKHPSELNCLMMRLKAFVLLIPKLNFQLIRSIKFNYYLHVSSH